MTIKNLAVVDELRIEFAAGFQVLTGDTGAGKSILVDAIGLILGDRAEELMIRDGADTALVEGVFTVEGNARVAETLAASGIEKHEDPSQVIIRRILQRGSSGRVFVNNQRASVTLLRELAPDLIDFTGQHDSKDLLDSRGDRDILDGFLPDRARLKIYQDLFLRCQAIYQEILQWQKKSLEREERLEWLEFQLRELGMLPVTSEEEAVGLLARREKQKHQGAIGGYAERLVQCLAEGEDNIAARISQLHAEGKRQTVLEQVFAPEIGRLRELAASAQDLSFDISRKLKLDADGGQDSAEDLDEKIHQLTRLTRKYGPTITDVLRRRQELLDEKKTWLDLDEHLAGLNARWNTDFEKLLQASCELTAARLGIKAKLEGDVRVELSLLGMEAARFVIEIATPPADVLQKDFAAYHQFGVDEVHFLLSPNPGLAPRPLAKIASGGELSRLFLALKQVLSQKREALSFIFDEIDTGISGAMVEKVGQRLKRLSQKFQVFCVTHHAPIAGLADRHYLVEKEQQKKSTITRVRALAAEDRIREMARLVGGASITPKTLAFARELLHKHSE